MNPVNGDPVPLGFGLGSADGRHWQESARWELSEVGDVSLVLLFVHSQRLGSVPLVKAKAPEGQISGDLKQRSPSSEGQGS